MRRRGTGLLSPTLLQHGGLAHGLCYHQTQADAIRAIGVTYVAYARWKQEFGGLKSDQVKRLKELEQENMRLRRAVSDLTLDKLILAEAAKGNP